MFVGYLIVCKPRFSFVFYYGVASGEICSHNAPVPRKETNSIHIRIDMHNLQQ